MKPNLPLEFVGQCRSFLCLLLVLLASSATVRAQGIALNGVGPVNRAMQGASTAAPIDAAGALYWNPATISGLAHNEMMVGFELLLPTEEVSSSVLGLGSGTDRGEPGAAVIPSMAWVHHCCDSRWTVGLGVYGVGGFRSNYQTNATNPILTPQPPRGVGLGRIFAELDILQVVPTLSYALSDRISVGIAPTLSIAKLGATPLFLAGPDDANGDNFFSYPPGLGTRYHFGGGVQAGVYYIGDNDIHLGASIKSPQWFETFRFQTTDELGAARNETVDFDYPMIVSLGASYSGWENLLVAVDVRYFDYKNTDGFRTARFNADGSVGGLGWKSIVSVSTGVQLRLTDCLYLRGGYSYQQDPISSANTMFNLGSPLILEHMASVGASCNFSEKVILHAAYVHAFEAENSGPMQGATGPIPGTSVATRVYADALTMGLTVRY